MTLAEIARVLAPTSRSLGDREPGLSSDGWFFTEHMVFPYGVHVAVVRIDLETCGLTVERYLVAYDVGRAVNPAMIEGQIAGGVAQGLGGALLEEFCYDEGGQPISVTFADYLMATATEMPPIQLLLTEDAPSPCNPLGLKGAGEGGTNAAGAAIAAAIDDAIGIPGAVTELPVTPQRLWTLLKKSSLRSCRNSG
jgi:CO/xanthine dehydrogenase Mo-binding subunit